MFNKKKKPSNILVKVGRAPGGVTEVALNGGRTVADALDAAELRQKDTEQLQVNGEVVDDLDYELEEGDRVILIKSISGGYIY